MKDGVLCELDKVEIREEYVRYHWLLTKYQDGSIVEVRKVSGESVEAAQPELRRVRSDMLGWSDCS